MEPMGDSSLCLGPLCPVCNPSSVFRCFGTIGLVGAQTGGIIAPSALQASPVPVLEVLDGSVLTVVLSLSAVRWH